jgi:hypothetical protein
MSTLPTSILQSDPHLVDDSVKDAETVLLVQPLAREGILIERSGTEDLTPSSSLRDKTINAFIHFAWCSTSIRGNFVNGLQGKPIGLLSALWTSLTLPVQAWIQVAALSCSTA